MASVYVVYFTHIVGIIVAHEDWFVIDASHLNKYVFFTVPCAHIDGLINVIIHAYWTVSI